MLRVVKSMPFSSVRKPCVSDLILWEIPANMGSAMVSKWCRTSSIQSMSVSFRGKCVFHPYCYPTLPARGVGNLNGKLLQNSGAVHVFIGNHPLFRGEIMIIFIHLWLVPIMFRLAVMR